MKNNKFYVTMNDTFMSRLRKDRRTEKLIIECDTVEEVETVIENAESRTDMNYINWHMRKYPYYNPKKFNVQVKDKNDFPRWFEKDCFK